MKKLPYWQQLLLISLASVVIAISSCKISKEAKKEKNISAANKYFKKALNKDTPTVAANTRRLFPCITTSVKVDSVAYIKWRDSLVYVPQVEYTTLHDTITTFENCKEIIKDLQEAVIMRDKKLKFIANNPPPPILIEQSIEDSAHVKILESALEVEEEINAALEKKIIDLEKKLATKKATAIILGTGCLLLIFGLFLLILKMFKSKK